MTTLLSFNVRDGQGPEGLVQSTDGALYGVTLSGGPSPSDGTVFKLDVGLPPFVLPNPISGATGSQVLVLGNSLSGTTAVTFNGTPASFTVVSSTEIVTAVPNRATSGAVSVTTPSGALTSNVNFQVLP